MIKTTIVIHNFNGMKFINNRLDSLQEQTVDTFRIIVVDNGSTDGSKELIKQDFPSVSLIEFKENTGFCRAVNAGILASQSEYVILLNNDTIVESGFVEQLQKAMDRHPKAFSVSACMVQMQQPELLDGAGDYYCALGWAFARGKDREVQECSSEVKVFSACAGAAIYRKKVFNKIGYFDENHFAYLEDLDIGYRARIYGYQNYYAPLAVVHHAGSGASGSKYNSFKTKLASRNSIYLVIKNMPFLQIILNFPFLLAGFIIKALFFAKKGFGGIYMEGLWKGIKLGFSTKGRKNKVPFYWSNFKNYLNIQIELWINIIRRFQNSI